jgi:hypothetical protein
MRVPLIVKLPGGARAGTVVDAPLVSNVDVYATVLAAAGASVPPDGESLDLLGASPGARPYLVGEYASSRAYLQQLRAANPAFDLEAHLLPRFVVYTSEFRTELDGPRASTTAPAKDGESEARIAAASRAAEQTLAAYLAAAKGDRGVSPAAGAADAQTRDQLEALGYVGKEDARSEACREEPKAVTRAGSRRDRPAERDQDRGRLRVVRRRGVVERQVEEVRQERPRARDEQRGSLAAHVRCRFEPRSPRGRPPQLVDGQRPQVVTSWHDVLAEIEHDAPHELLARGFGQRMQAGEIARVERRGGLDLDTDQLAPQRLEHDVTRPSAAAPRMRSTPGLRHRTKPRGSSHAFAGRRRRGARHRTRR